MRSGKKSPFHVVFLDVGSFFGIMAHRLTLNVTENLMSRICNITFAMPHKGRRIHRSGLAKKKGGIGRHVTKTVNRTVFPNLQEKRIWVPELNGGKGGFIRMKLSCKALRTISKNGAYNTLKKAGILY